ncbi:MAG: polymer-forming cytoskeletal protein [Gammaproteobacteria bacterium]|nr:polymer-forming cytoskeletal protein [Gammaproteobacteria bacterium]
MQSFFTGGKGRRALDGAKQFTTLIGSATRLTGTLRGSENCIVNGTVEGHCEIDGTLVVGETGRWHGNIAATLAIISGEVVGDIVAGEKLELSSSARVTGNITSPVVAMAEGAIHQGGIKMTREGGGVSSFQEKRKVTPDSEP